MFTKNSPLSTCTRCTLHATRRNAVYDVAGSVARIVAIGEFPEVADDVLGVPFVGADGKMFRALLIRAGILEPVAFAYMTACRVRRKDDDMDETAATKEQIAACMPHTNEFIHRVAPAGVVLLGATVAKYYTKLSSDYTICKVIHPSALVRTGGTRSPYYLETITALERFYAEIS
jgi:DNA polymerase